MTPDVLATLLGDRMGGHSRAAGHTWLAIGRKAADALKGAGVVQVLEARGLYEAFVSLSDQEVSGALVGFDHLLDRPDAAVNQLEEALAGAPLLVLGNPPTPLRRSLLRRGVRITNGLPKEALQGGASQHDVTRHATRRPEAIRSTPRADDVPRRGAVVPPIPPEPGVRRPAAGVTSGEERTPIDIGRFAEGCLVRMASPKALVVHVVETLKRASGAGRASLLLKERGRDSLRLRHVSGGNEALVGKIRVALGAGIAGRVARLGRPAAGAGTRGGPRSYEGTAYVVLPLGKAERCQGVLCLTGLPDDRIPDARSLADWARLCRRAGQAIGHARRLRRAETERARDLLTGLPNRRAFERAVTRELERARRAGSGLLVGLFDVDRFKRVNDEYGHQIGDRVLVQVARRLESAFRETDLVSRWGGEEFAVLLPGVPPDDPAEAQAAFDRARQAVGSRPLPLGPGLPPLATTVSGGLACWPADGPDLPALLRAADQALYEAKASGRNQVRAGTRPA